MNPYAAFVLLAVCVTAVLAWKRWRGRDRRLPAEPMVKPPGSESLESLGILAGGLAHEFNNLLGAMGGNVELAKLVTPADGPVLPYLKTLEVLITRASGLVRQILTDAGRATPVAISLDLNHQAEELTRLLRASLSWKANLSLSTEPGLPPIKGDPALVQQVIMNLVINASEAVAPRTGVISIRTGREILGAGDVQGASPGRPPEPGPYVFLEVADDAPGLPPELLERLFDPAGAPPAAGRRLGLPAALGTMKALQGGIQVHSEARGTTFRLLFPAALNGRAPEAPDHQSFQDAIGSCADTGTVLVVDDEEPIRATAVQALQRLGFETIEAGNGLEALRLFEANRDRIRLVLMDLTMPRMDGEEAYRELRSRGMLTPVILTSGFCERDVLERFQGKGIAGFLQKPYRLHTLVQTTRKALGREVQPPGLWSAEPRTPLAAPQDLDLGCPMLDQQHRRLIEAFNRLVQVMGPDAQGKEQEKALACLKETALIHFGVEETLMESLAYPRTREHQTSHVRLIDQINTVNDRIRQGLLTFSPSLLDYLECWLVHHSQDEDRRLALFIKARGH